MGVRPGLKRPSRFFGNEAIESQEILESHVGATVQRMAEVPVVLAVQDTTELILTLAALLFTTLEGKLLSDRYLRVMVKRYGTKAGVLKDVHPHTLRHTFATDLYRETKNIRLVQKALGHADLSTTMIYTHIVDDELEDALKTFRRAA